MEIYPDKPLGNLPCRPGRWFKVNLFKRDEKADLRVVYRCRKMNP